MISALATVPEMVSTLKTDISRSSLALFAGVLVGTYSIHQRRAWTEGLSRFSAIFSS